MSRKRLAGWVIFAGGLVLLVVSLFADQLGIGGGNGTFGLRQITGTVAGVVILVVGVVIALRKRSNSDEPKHTEGTGTSPT